MGDVRGPVREASLGGWATVFGEMQEPTLLVTSDGHDGDSRIIYRFGEQLKGINNAYFNKDI